MRCPGEPKLYLCYSSLCPKVSDDSIMPGLLINVALKTRNIVNCNVARLRPEVTYSGPAIKRNNYHQDCHRRCQGRGSHLRSRTTMNIRTPTNMAYHGHLSLHLTPCSSQYGQNTPDLLHHFDCHSQIHAGPKLPLCREASQKGKCGFMAVILPYDNVSLWEYPQRVEDALRD